MRFLRSARAWRITNFVLALAWLVMVPAAYFTGWVESLVFISAASIYANFVGHLSAWRADEPN